MMKKTRGQKSRWTVPLRYNLYSFKQIYKRCKQTIGNIENVLSVCFFKFFWINPKTVHQYWHCAAQHTSSVGFFSVFCLFAYKMMFFLLSYEATKDSTYNL